MDLDPTAFLSHGLTGALVFLGAMWIRSGMKLTVHLDPTQLALVNEVVKVLPARIEALEKAHDAAETEHARLALRVTRVEVQVDERTKRRVSSDRNPAIPG